MPRRAENRFVRPLIRIAGASDVAGSYRSTWVGVEGAAARVTRRSPRYIAPNDPSAPTERRRIFSSSVRLRRVQKANPATRTTGERRHVPLFEVASRGSRALDRVAMRDRPCSEEARSPDAGRVDRRAWPRNGAATARERLRELERAKVPRQAAVSNSSNSPRATETQCS